MGYVANSFSQEDYYFDIYINDKANKKTWVEILNDTGAYGICNLGYFSLSNFSLQSNLKYRGNWLCGPQYSEYGIAIDKDGKMTCEANTLDSNLVPTDNLYSYTCGLPCLMRDGEIINTAYTAKNGCTMIGFDRDNNVSIVMSDKDYGLDTNEAVDILKRLYNCTDILRMDGSWSTNGIIDHFTAVQPNTYRYDKVYLLIYAKTRKHSLKNIVTIDTPDVLENKVVTTGLAAMLNSKTNGVISPLFNQYNNAIVDLSPEVRALRSNNTGAKLFISVAYKGTSDTIDVACTTSSAGDTAARNVLAKLIETSYSEAGYKVQKRQYDFSNKALVKASAPAVLIELYNRVDVYILAECIAKQLNVPFINEGSDVNFKKLIDRTLIPNDITSDQVVLWKDLANLLNKLNII